MVAQQTSNHSRVSVMRCDAKRKVVLRCGVGSGESQQPVDDARVAVPGSSDENKVTMRNSTNASVGNELLHDGGVADLRSDEERRVRISRIQPRCVAKQLREQSCIAASRSRNDRLLACFAKHAGCASSYSADFARRVGRADVTHCRFAAIQVAKQSPAHKTTHKKSMQTQILVKLSFLSAAWPLGRGAFRLAKSLQSRFHT